MELIDMEFVEIFIKYTLEAQNFCANLAVVQLECMVDIVECYLDDNRLWCEMYYMENYHGI